MKKLLLLTLVILLACSPKANKETVKPVENPLFDDALKEIDDDFNNLSSINIQSVNLYCFCFSDSIQKYCNTFVRVSPESLIKAESQIGSLADKNACDEFFRLIHTDYEIIDTIQGNDVRLVAAINTKGKQQKTLALFRDSMLCYQDKYLIKYKRSISSMFRQAFHLTKIHCD